MRLSLEWHGWIFYDSWGLTRFKAGGRVYYLGPVAIYWMPSE